jgi:hypothetical protein
MQGRGCCSLHPPPQQQQLGFLPPINRSSNAPPLSISSSDCNGAAEREQVGGGAGGWRWSMVALEQVALEQVGGAGAGGWRWSRFEGGAGEGGRWSRWRWAHLHLPPCDSPFVARALAVGQLPASGPFRSIPISQHSKCSTRNAAPRPLGARDVLLETGKGQIA